MLDPARLAVLADALEEAGCTEDAVLEHIRSPGRTSEGAGRSTWSSPRSRPGPGGRWSVPPVCSRSASEGPPMPDPVAPDLRDLLALHLTPGIGPARIAALLEHFGSAARVLRASPDELIAVPGIGGHL